MKTTNFRGVLVALAIAGACLVVIASYVGNSAALGEVLDPDVPILWVHSRPPLNYTNVVVVDPQHSANVYAGGGGFTTTVSYSRDYGVTWQAPDTVAFGGGMEALAIDPVSPNYLYAGYATGHFARSQNGARDWEQVGDRLFGNGNPTVAYVHPVSPTLVLVGATVDVGPAIYRSTDRFDTWDVIPLTYPINRTIAQILHDPAAPERLYAVAPDEGVFLSEDWGKTWVNTGLITQRLLIDPNDPDMMYRLDCTPYRSDDGGVHWEELPFTESRCFQDMYMDPQNSAYLYLGSQYSVPARSLDGGQSWQMLYGYGAEAHPQSHVFAIDPQDSTRLYTSEVYYSVYLDEAQFLPFWK